MTNPHPSPAIHTIDTSTLLDALLAQQRRVVGIVDGLDRAAIHRPALPSGWTFAGMVQHLTETTIFWFEAVMAGEPFRPVADDFAVDPRVEPAELVERYTAATGRGHDRVRSMPLDAPPAWWPEGMFGPWRLHSLYEVLQHMLVETATHAGHLDAARELLDGRTWDYPTGRLTEAGAYGPPGHG